MRNRSSQATSRLSKETIVMEPPSMEEGSLLENQQVGSRNTRNELRNFVFNSYNLMKETFMTHADKHRSIISNKCLLFTAVGIVYALGAYWLIRMLNTPACLPEYGLPYFDLNKFRYVDSDYYTWHQIYSTNGQCGQNFTLSQNQNEAN